MINKIAVIQCYINNKTGKEVQIAIPTTQRELNLLNRAYNIAVRDIWQ